MCRFIVYIHRYTSFLTDAALTKAAFVVRPNHLENKQSPMQTQAVNI